MMSRLPAQLTLKSVAIALLLGGTYLSLRIGRSALAWVLRGDRQRTRRVGAALLMLHLLLVKLDQHVLPNLYDYLHAALTAGAWAVASAAVGLLARGSRVEQTFRRGWRPAAVAAALSLAALVALGQLPSNQNVRVSLFDARASSSRSLMQGLEPWVRRALVSTASADAIAAARQARRQRRLASNDTLPTWPDAHILLVTIDALRADHLGVYGYDRGLSPNIDALAANGVVFDRAYAQAPHSSYSISSLMVSEYLHETVGLGQTLPEATLASLLTEQGYHTAAFYTLGIFHTEGERLARYRDTAFGFGRHDHTNLKAEELTDRVLEEAGRIVEAGEPPSLLWAHYFDVHEPYEETSLGTSDVDRYDGEIRNVDRAFGRLLRELDGRFERDVIVVITADHGEEFRDHGGVYHGSTLYDEQVRVPLIIAAKGVTPGHIEQPVETIDVTPTLLSMAETLRPAAMRGDDLRAFLVGEKTDPGPAFSAVSDKRMAIRWPYKLVADLRFNLFEVYDLEKDPQERVNLSGNTELLDGLKGEIYAQLDSLQAAESDDPHQLALERGRLGDRRAVEGLGALLLDQNAASAMRREAGQLLGRLADPSSSDELTAALKTNDPLVAAEAAIALGRHYDQRARTSLQSLVASDDPDLRTRAAVSLGRLRDRLAVPGLLETLRFSKDSYEREEAVRWLGRLRDPAAVEPLVELLPEFRVRYLTVVALGHIGDRRAYEPLAQTLQWETHSNVRNNLARALGQLGDERGIGPLLRLAQDEPELTMVSEALVRLGALEQGAIGGADMTASLARQKGLGRCEEGPLLHDWDYLARTWCRTTAKRATFAIHPIPEGSQANVVLRGRRIDASDPITVYVRVGKHELEPKTLDGQWNELRWPLEADVATGNARVTIEAGEPTGRLAIDHLLLIPGRSTPPEAS